MPSLAQRLLRSRWPAATAAMASGPATSPCAPISASIGSPSSSAFALLMTTTAHAPSEICDAEPAVIVPSCENAGRSLPERLDGGVRADALVLADDDRVALALRDLDRDDLVVEAARSSIAAAARWCDRAANSSCSSRVRCSSRALRLSVRSPIAWSVKTSQRPS